MAECRSPAPSTCRKSPQLFGHVWLTCSRGAAMRHSRALPAAVSPDSVAGRWGERGGGSISDRGPTKTCRSRDRIVGYRGSWGARLPYRAGIPPIRDGRERPKLPIRPHCRIRSLPRRPRPRRPTRLAERPRHVGGHLTRCSQSSRHARSSSSPAVA